MGAPKLPAANFVATDLTERPITLADGSVYPALIRQPTTKTWRNYLFAAGQATASQDGEDAFDRAMVALIVECWCQDGGTPFLTPDEVRALRIEVQTSAINAIRESILPPKV